MKTALWQRLARMEQQLRRDDDGGFRLWVGTGENELRSPDGEVITLEEFDRRYPDAIDISADAGAHRLNQETGE